MRENKEHAAPRPFQRIAVEAAVAIAGSYQSAVTIR